MSDTAKQFKRQLPKNVIMSGLSFLTTLLSAYWLTPYFVNHLGTAAYAFIPLAALLTQYVAIITKQLAGAVTRFLAVEMQKPGGEPNRIFNSALVLYLILAAIQIPIFTLGVVYADHLFTIPSEFRTDALILLGCSAGGFLVSFFGGVFSVPLYANNRLDIFATIDLLRVIGRLVLIVVLFSGFGPQLRFIGYIDLFLMIVQTLVYVSYGRRLAPELKIALGQVDWGVLKPVFHMSFWTLITQLGSLLYLRSDIWLINRFISAEAAGQYAAILVIGNSIRQMGNHFSGQFAPTIINCWAKEDLLSLRRLLSFSVKTLACCLAIPVALICTNGQDILTLWLGQEFSGLSMLLVVLAVHLPVNIGVLPLFNFHTASNTIKWPALVTFVMGILNLGLSYYLGVVVGMGAIGVGLATAVMLTLKNAVFTPMYGACVLKLPVWTFMGAVYGSVLMMGLVYLLCRIPVAAWLGLNSAGLWGLLVQAVVVCGLSGIAGWFFVLSKKEKGTILDMLPAKFNRASGGAGA